MKCRERKLYSVTFTCSFSPQVGDRALVLPKTTAISRSWGPGCACFGISAAQAPDLMQIWWSAGRADELGNGSCSQARAWGLRGGENPLVLAHLWGKGRRRSSSWSKIHQDLKKNQNPVKTEPNSTINVGGKPEWGDGNLTFPVPPELCWELGGFDGVFLWMAKRSKSVFCGKDGEQEMGQENQGRSEMETEGSGGRRGCHHQVGNCVQAWLSPWTPADLWCLRLLWKLLLALFLTLCSFLSGSGVAGLQRKLKLLSHFPQLPVTSEGNQLQCCDGCFLLGNIKNGIIPDKQGVQAKDEVQVGGKFCNCFLFKSLWISSCQGAGFYFRFLFFASAGSRVSFSAAITVKTDYIQL